MAGQSIPYTPITFSAVLPLKVGIFIVNMPPLLSRVLDVLGGIYKKGKSSEFNS